MRGCNKELEREAEYLKTDRKLDFLTLLEQNEKGEELIC